MYLHSILVSSALIWLFGQTGTANARAHNYKHLIFYKGTRGSDAYWPCFGVGKSIRPPDKKNLCKNRYQSARPSLPIQNPFCALLQSGCPRVLVGHEDDLARPALEAFGKNLPIEESLQLVDHLKSTHMLVRCTEKGVRESGLLFRGIISSFLDVYSQELSKQNRGLSEKDDTLLHWLTEVCLSKRKDIGIPVKAVQAGGTGLIDAALYMEQGIGHFVSKEFSEAEKAFGMASATSTLLLAELLKKCGNDRTGTPLLDRCIKDGKFSPLFDVCIGTDSAKFFMGIMILYAEYMVSWSEMKKSGKMLFTKRAVERMGNLIPSGTKNWHPCAIIEAFGYDKARLETCRSQ
ncbi:MAG: hypothetical protein JRF33_19000 [Deltaproteobacteria bacterium]|nr:hypothetical protein [Deltaproteobacteria bacterium]